MHFECHTAIYSMEDVYNFDEIGLFFHHEPQETLASKPVKGKKIDKERIIVGLVGEEDERREKKEEKTPVSSSKALFRFSSPIGSFYRIGI